LRCDCGGVLEVKNNFSENFNNLLNQSELDTKRYLDFLPVKNEYIPDLTPPITPKIKKKIDGIDVIFKPEYLMPSGSFKDRGTYVTIAKLKQEGIKEVSLDSSGNAAISLALYGRSEGIDVHVFVSESISQNKMKMLNMLDPIIHKVSGSRMDVHEKAENFDKRTYVSHWYNPFFLEGTKITAYEVGEKMKIDNVIVPTGSGTMFLGLYKGFKELYEFGVVDKIPKFISIEAEGFESLKDKSDKESKLAKGIEIIDPPRKEQMEDVLEHTDGFSTSVSDEKISHAQSELADLGFLVENTSAAAYAAFEELKNDDRFEDDEKVLIPLTGSGLKSF